MYALALQQPIALGSTPPCMARLSAAGASVQSPREDCGLLDQLPDELICLIITHLDLDTLHNFRSLNRRALQIVESLWEYRLLYRHCRYIIRRILARHYAGHVTCAMLTRALLRKTCETCGNFGGLFYMLTCQRVCAECVARGFYQPCRPEQAVHETKFLPQGMIKEMPRMRCEPGLYPPGQQQIRRVELVDTMSLMKEAGLHLDHHRRNSWNNLAFFGLDHPPAWLGGRYADGGLFVTPYVALFRMPAVDRVTGRAEWGFQCTGCRCRDGMPMFYCSETFREHLDKVDDEQRANHARQD